MRPGGDLNGENAKIWRFGGKFGTITSYKPNLLPRFIAIASRAVLNEGQ